MINFALFFIPARCLADINCKSSEVCVNGQCKAPCADRNPCGLNAQCQTVKHKKRCTCPPSFTGNGEVECVRVPNTCISDQSCPDQMNCVDGICMLKCLADTQCAPNERCQNGQCMLTCRLDNDCFLGHVCLNNMCLVGCKVNSDCPTSQSCIANRCVDPCADPSTCGPNSECQGKSFNVFQFRFTKMFLIFEYIWK